VETPADAHHRRVIPGRVELLGVRDILHAYEQDHPVASSHAAEEQIV
jgi:hypothetical protein